MKVNTVKTKMLCISDAMSFLPASYINTEGRRVASGGREDSMKLLGLHVSNCPEVLAHVKALQNKFWLRFWVIIPLWTFGFSEEELVRVYETIVWPVAEYCAVAYHPQLADKQDELLERQQSHALKLIYGPTVSYTHLTLPTIYPV